jgi:type IV pilus assembly protein PilZ
MSEPAVKTAATAPTPGEVRPTVLQLTIKDKSALYAAYMPFITGGGLFVPTKKKYKLGEEVFMLLRLLDNTEKLSIAGTIAWITPQGAQGGRAAGIGVRFDAKDSGEARNKIEALLGGALNSERPTHTM